MKTTRRTALGVILGASAGLGQTYNSGQTIGFKADNVPERTECGIGALMPRGGCALGRHLQLAQGHDGNRPGALSYR